MCVGIPRKIVEITDSETNIATIEVNGKKHEISIALLVDDNHTANSYIGEWVLVNLGFAMSHVDEAEAHKTLELLRELGEAQMQMDSILNNK